MNTLMIHFFCIQNGIDIKKYTNAVKKEIFRKSIHVCTAFVPFLLHYEKIPVIILLCLAGIFYIICESLRKNGINVPFISAVTAVAARKRDENHFVLGPVTLVCGVIICAVLWQESFAAAGIYALAFGDGLASLCGKMFGRVRIPLTRGKTVVGSLTCFTAIFCSTWCTLHDTKTAVIAAFAGMLIEVLPLMDFDNLIIPVVLGGLLQFLFPHI